MTKKAFIIAEIGSNHNGDMDLCRKMVDAAKRAGADAAKFQSFTDKSLISEAEYARRTDYGDTEADKKKHFGTLKEMVDAYWLRPEQHHEIAKYCESIGIEFMSTPFSREEVDLLDACGVKRFKVASMDVNNPELLKYIASKGKPVIISTGMATLGEIEQAIFTLEEAGCLEVTVLHCTSVYPPNDEDVALNNIKTFAQAFDIPVGYSDHSIGTDVPLIALSLGSTVIEKHFTIDKDLEGWDHAISADEAEMAQIAHFASMTDEELQAEARKVEKYDIFLGRNRRIVSEREGSKIEIMRRCIVAKKALKAGHVITMADLDYKRPGNGIRPDEAKYILGRELVNDVPYDHEFEWSDFGVLKSQQELQKAKVA